MTAISTIVELGKEIRYINSEMEKKLKEIDQQNEKKKQRESQKKQNILEVSMSVLRLQNNNDTDIGMDRIFLEEEDNQTKKLRSTLVEVCKILEFLYATDILDPACLPMMKEVEEILTRSGL